MSSVSISTRCERHPSRLTEIANLSGAIGDMAQGLAAFRKYIPADLVRRLISDGNGARLGGAVRPMSVMFIDLAGFTGMSERLGDRIIPLLSRYFDVVSRRSRMWRHHRQVHRRCRDGVLGRAVRQSRSRGRLLPRRAGLPARGGGAGLVDDHGER